jgi:23S rRNA pseudouridine1911/1915/1917 synthase
VETSRLAEEDMVSELKKYIARQRSVSSPYLGVVHRLDQPVSGLLVFAREQKAAAALSGQLRQGALNKDYLALCLGQPEEKEGQLIHYLAKREKKAEVVDEGDREAKLAKLSYRVREEREDCSLLDIHLESGRFHQIRAQFSAVGHPLLGDRRYGNEESGRLSMQKGIKTVALCACRLGFTHPANGKEMEFVLSREDLPLWV